MIYQEDKNRKVEILAPAGSYESFQAAVAAGADAVYAGGPRFGARAYAVNFTEEKLLEAIDYAHLHGRKFYLTVNTLLKDAEMDELHDYLEPLYLAGLDAVIIQDMGVFEYVRTHFPGMDIHASTQMTVTAFEGAKFLQKEGAVRIVPSRELSLDEIRRMKELTGMEIECFVHGALCYCYSGQCLMSSMIGGRSGNRGQCAQPCRLPYTINGEKKYWLSPKDICTLELIPDLIEAGIDSFKIEGRMKRPEYVAGVTAIYRKYADMYLQKGRDGFAVSEADKEALMDLYNRGGFSKGYYTRHNGRDMMSIQRPNHAGVAVISVTGQKGREVSGKALTGIHKGDVLELGDRQENYTFGKEYEKGSAVMFLAPKGQRFEKGRILYRTKNEKLLDHLEAVYMFGKTKEKIYGFLTLSVGKPATLIVGLGEITAEARSKQAVEEAEKSPLDEERIRRQILKTGNTEFEFERLEIRTEGNVFFPMQQLNELRRQGLEALEKAVCKSRRREQKEQDGTETKRSVKNSKLCNNHQDKEIKLSVLAETLEQLCAAAEFSKAARVYVDSAMNGELSACTEALELCRRIRGQKREVFLAMPHIFREQTEELFFNQFAQILKKDFDGVLVRNLETLRFLEKCGFDRSVILDHNLYVFNGYAKTFWKDYGIDRFTLPLELNSREMKRLGAEEGELVIYGYLPVMISAQCVANTVYGCRKKESFIVMTDRLNNPFTVRNRCRECYNVIYNPVPVYLLDQYEEIRELGCRAVRLQFSREDKKETEQILREYDCVFMENHIPGRLPDKYTRGHFGRGIL